MTSGNVSVTYGTTRTDTHDPLCRDHHACTCDLIARAREDERALGRVSKASGELAHRAFQNGRAQGYLEAIEQTAWTCHDCGNTYDPDITECPNRYLDEAKVAVRTAQRRGES